MEQLALGTIRKMESEIDSAGLVHYTLPLGDERVEMNPLIGEKISMQFAGNIYCIATGDKIKKTYNQGFSYKAFISLACCDICIVKPEKCHFHLGTCREPKWGEEHCFQPHYVYLSQTSCFKVGITRQTQIPTRWVDQGANFAIKLFKVPDRITSGRIEVLVKSEVADKTNWRKMLQESPDDMGLLEFKEQILEKYGDEAVRLGAEICDEDVTEISFPVEAYPEKVKSMGFDKIPKIEGVLKGIKGQYLILEQGVINMRKHQGYEITISRM